MVIFCAFRGIVASLSAFILLGVTVTPDGPFKRPHPAIWRLTFIISIVYELGLIFVLYQVGGCPSFLYVWSPLMEILFFCSSVGCISISPMLFSLSCTCLPLSTCNCSTNLHRSFSCHIFLSYSTCIPLQLSPSYALPIFPVHR